MSEERSGPGGSETGAISQDGQAVKASKRMATRAPRPAAEIYRPPGLRRESDDIDPKTPNSPVGFRGTTGNSNSPSPPMAAETKPSAAGSKQPAANHHAPAGSSGANNENNAADTAARVWRPKMPPRQKSFVKDTPKPEEIEAELRSLFDSFQLGQTVAEEYAAAEFRDEIKAPATAQLLVQTAVESGKPSKAVAKACALLNETPSGREFHGGLVAACRQYMECRDRLRGEHFGVWLAFLNFLSDLYAALGDAYEGDLVGTLFACYDYTLQSPVLETLKIEELESLISSLLNVGFRLERQCPVELAELKNTLRDAFIRSQEPWARKMILLLIELSAGGWKLPSEANEYYFQTGNQQRPLTQR